MSPQAAFRAALLDPAGDRPDGLLDGAGRPAGRRYDVYRNNVAVSLREALAAGFPATVRLIGQENFDNAARGFLRQSPPNSPLMTRYGEAFPAYLEGLEQLAALPYVADVARIDLALRQSYHAADSHGIDPAALQKLDEKALLSARVSFAPSMRLLRSDWPAGSVWRFTMRGDPAPTAATPEDVLILRHDFDPEPHVLGPGAADVLRALLEGIPFGAAIEAGGPDFDLAALLSLLLANTAITDIT